TAALRPVAAGLVVAGRERRSVRLRAGQNVVHVGRIAAVLDHLALFGERSLLRKIVLPMQLRNILGDHHALRVRPRALAATVLRVAGAGPRRAEERGPGLAAGAGRLRQRLTVPIGAFDAAEVGALADARAGDEEAHRRGLSLGETRAGNQ